MTGVTAALYVLVFGVWFVSIQRENGIGIGARFFYGLSVVLYFLLSPLLAELFGGRANSFAPAEALDTTCQLVLLGLACYLLAGYWVLPILLCTPTVLPPGFWSRLVEPRRLKRQHDAGWWVFGIGCMSLPFNGIAFGIPTLQAVWSQVNLLVETGLVMLCLHYVLARKYAHVPIVFALLGVYGVFRAATTGFFSSTMFSGLVLLSLSMLGQSWRGRNLALLTLTLALGFIPYTLWMGGRNELRAAIRQDASLETRLLIAWGIFQNTDFSFPDDESALERLRMRGDFSELMAIATVHTPAREPFANGATLMDGVVALIPRALWPDKPVKLGGSAFVSRYTGLTFAKSTSVGMNYLFEFYVNFGWVGVFVGMFLLGLGIGFLERLYYLYAPTNLSWEWTTILCMWTICFAADTFAHLSMTLPCAVVIGVVLHHLIGAVLPTGPALTQMPRSALPRSSATMSGVPTTSPREKNALHDS